MAKDILALRFTYVVLVGVFLADAVVVAFLAGAVVVVVAVA